MPVESPDDQSPVLSCTVASVVSRPNVDDQCLRSFMLTVTSEASQTCDDVDVRIEVLAEAYGGTVALKPIPELLLNGS